MIKTINRIIKDDFSLAEDLSREENITSKYESINISPQLPIVWDKAKDFSVYDEEGNKWINRGSFNFELYLAVCKAKEVNLQIETKFNNFRYDKKKIPNK